MRKEKIEELRKQIEIMRKELVQLYSEGMNQEEILKLSREMDKLIVEYQKILKSE